MDCLCHEFYSLYIHVPCTDMATGSASDGGMGWASCGTVTLPLQPYTPESESTTLAIVSMDSAKNRPLSVSNAPELMLIRPSLSRTRESSTLHDRTGLGQEPEPRHTSCKVSPSVKAACGAPTILRLGGTAHNKMRRNRCYMYIHVRYSDTIEMWT